MMAYGSLQTALLGTEYKGHICIGAGHTCYCNIIVYATKPFNNVYQMIWRLKYAYIRYADCSQIENKGI